MLTPFMLILYLPLLLAVIVIVTRYRQINKIWIAVLLLGIFTGVDPLIALVFLFVHRKILQAKTQPLADASSATPVQVVMPAGQTVITTQTTNGVNLTAQKAAGTALGGIVTVVLWMSGLVAVGFFVMITVAVIQCSNNPKCM